MYRTVYYCLAINLMAVNGFNGFDCSESDVLVAESEKQNTTQFSMQAFTEDLLHTRTLTAATLASNGCPFEVEILNSDSEFFVACETEINCLTVEEDIAIRTMKTFFLECENVSLNVSTHDVFNSDDGAIYVGAKMAKTDEPADTRRLIIAAASVAAGLATVAVLAAGLYKLQTVLQSGSYLFPNTPSPPAFSEA